MVELDEARAFFKEENGDQPEHQNRDHRAAPKEFFDDAI